ncbi:MAG TPA: T9SS type A sorting domain-containing protein [Chitinophagaceae bacterium]|nr:T9SS type A sorting domain-containing protein [Chitinophagaceae bacterium]
MALITITGMSQNGTVGSPFTALGQAQNVGSNGIYFFNIGGNTFSTQVEVGGWVLAAAGSGTPVASLTTTTALTLASDGILPTVIYTSNLVTTVRFNATSGPSLPLDVNTTNATVLGNLQANRTLSVGLEGLGVGMWAGSGTSHMDVIGSPSDNSTLNLILWHSNGNFSGVHWRLPGDECVSYSDGPGGFENAMNLWIKAAFVALPVELTRFNAMAENGKIKIEWTTASETNNAFFTVEKSTDGRSWQVLKKINGAGNSSVSLDYVYFDNNPVIGSQYYRLKQTDIDGQSKYSSTRLVKYRADGFNVSVYPNPVPDQITIKITNQPVLNTEVKIFDLSGKSIFQGNYVSNLITIDTRKLSQGMYVVEINSNGIIERVKIRKD